VDHAEQVSGLAFPAQVGSIVNADLDSSVRLALAYSLRWTLHVNADYAASSRSVAVAELLKRNITFREACSGLIRRRRINAVLFKEPFLAFAPAFAYDAVPWSRITLIHRDGRDVADSLVRSFDVLGDRMLESLDHDEQVLGRLRRGKLVPWWVPEGEDDGFLSASQFVRCVWMWREMVRRCLAFADRPDVIGSGRVDSIRYEDLVASPLEVGERLLRHHGLAINRRVRKRLRSGHQESIGIHKHLPKAEIMAATTLAEAELVSLGYLPG
jgi:hypothetical protein